MSATKKTIGNFYFNVEIREGLQRWLRILISALKQQSAVILASPLVSQRWNRSPQPFLRPPTGRRAGFRGSEGGSRESRFDDCGAPDLVFLLCLVCFSCLFFLDRVGVIIKGVGRLLPLLLSTTAAAVIATSRCGSGVQCFSRYSPNVRFVGSGTCDTAGSFEGRYYSAGRLYTSRTMLHF